MAQNRARLTTFLAGTAFLALMGAVMFLLAATIYVPSILRYRFVPGVW